MPEPTVPPTPTPPSPSPASAASPSTPTAIASLVLGIVSFGCGFFAAIPAIICGHIARTRIRKSGGALSGTGLANAGLILGYFVLALNIVGIPLFIGMVRTEYTRVQRLAAARQEVVSSDGRVGLSVPGDWTTLAELNQVALIKTGNKFKEQYLIVIPDSKSSLPPSMTLEKHHQATRDRMLQKMKDSSATPSAGLTIDGCPARQDEISGTQQNVNLVFLHTTVETKDHFYQILVWTLQPRWKQDKALFDEVTRSFHQTK